MINTIQKRPQSKSYRSRLDSARPITRSNDQEQAQKCFQMGKEHYNRNDIQKAQKFYLEAIIHNPSHFKSYCNLGLCYKLRGQYPNAIQAYKQSLAITPEDAITNYNLANVYRLIGNEDKSIAHYFVVINLKEKEGVDVGSLYLDSYNNLGICYKNIENYAQAIECFEKILKERSSEESVKFNLAVCYLRVVRRMLKSSKTQNIMLVKQNISKTTSLFQQVLKHEPKNQVALVALIQLSSVSNQQHQNIKKCLSEIDELMKRPETSGFIKQEGSKVKAFCLNLLAKYEQSAEEYKKAIQKKKQEDERKMAQEKEKQRVLRQKQQKQGQQAQKKVEKQQQKAKVIPQQSSESTYAVQMSKQQIIQSTSSIQAPEINPKQVFQTMVSFLVEKLKSIIEDPAELSQHMNLSQSVEKIIQSLEKEHLANTKDKKISQRIRKQLSIIGCSILGQSRYDKQFLSQAFDTYINYFLQGNLHTVVTKSTLFLQTHRAIASVLTSLGQSQKAIEHYQIISQQFTEKNIHDRDPLQQLHSGLAVNYESQGLHQKAIKEFQQAIRLNPRNYVFYYNLGYCQHCAGKNAQAVRSYSKFLQEIQKQSTLQNESRQSYILQALISIFICSQGSIEEKIKKCSEIESKIQQFCGPDAQNVLKIIDHKSLMHYYLLACDLYEQLIFEVQKSSSKQASKQASKAHKQKLFTIYINLLQLPNCPDRDQILINCGNLLFEQKQFFGALQFYQRVSKSKTQIYNIIALTLMNINQHQRALNSIQFAIQCDKQNHIYEVNYEIIKWAYGLEITAKDNLLWQKYPCRKDVEFDSRVEYAKSIINKLTAIIEKQLAMNDSAKGLTVQTIFNKLLDEKEDATLWKDPEALQKHIFLKDHVKRQCGNSNSSKENQNIDTSLVQQNITLVKQILQTITTQAQTSPQSIQKTINSLTQKLTTPSSRKSPNYLNILEQSLALFIYHNSSSPAQLKVLKQKLQPKTPNIKTYQLTFPDPVTPDTAKFPQKNYTVVYPSIQLKLENLIQSLLSWNTMMEEKFVYLMKIVDFVAYKAQLRSPTLTDYNFACCKYAENCEKCFKKAVFVLAKLFHIDCKQNFILSTKDDSSLTAKKKAAYNAFVNKFGKNLEPILTLSPGKDTKTLSIKLNQQTLPLQMQLNFSTKNEFQKFLKAFCNQVSAKQPAYDKNDNQLYLILNKLVRVRCTWKETDFTEEFISTVVKSTLGLRESAVEFFDSEILKQWAEDEALKVLLSKIFDIGKFLK